MKYIYIIAGWFGYKRDHSEQAAGILNEFIKKVEELEELNADVKRTQEENDKAIIEKQKHNETLTAVAAKNTKVVANIRSLIGE